MNSFQSLYSFWIRKTQKYEIPNCFVCAMRTPVECAYIILPLKGFCRHATKRRFSEKPHFKERMCCKWISFGIVLIMTLAVMWNIKNLISDSCVNSKVQCFLMISDQLFSTSAIIAAALFSLRWKGWMEIQNELCKIVEERKEYGITHLLTFSFCRKFTLLAIMVKVALWLFHLLFCALLLFSSFFTKTGFTQSFLINEITVLFGVVLQLVPLYIYSHQLIIMKVMMKNAQKQLIANMNYIGNHTSKSIEDFIRTYVKYFFAIIDVYHMTSNVLNPAPLLWLAFSVANIIVNVYLFIIQWDNRYFGQIIILEIRTLVFTLVLGYVVTLADAESTVSM